jgi:pyruvate dehydrogenase E2 component (dihydrolipoamide acetyltransferase)
MATEILMPKLGQTVEEAKIERWVKKEGDEVKKGDVLLEVTTDKATLEVESFSKGILRKILYRDGETVPVTTVIGYIGSKDEDIPEVPSGVSEAAEESSAVEETPSVSAPQKSSVKEEAAQEGRIKASPLAKKLASKKGINLASVRGTGPGGRITKEDVLSAEGGEARTEAVSGVIELSSMRKAIAEQMSKSKREIPHYYVMKDADMSVVLSKKADEKASITDYIIHACAKCLVEFPDMNAHWEDGKIRRFSEVNLGIAVGIDDGLIVPVLREAHRKNIGEISSENKRLAGRAREKKLSPDEFSGGTFTISNLGMYKIDSFLPIINPPEVGILGVGSIKQCPVAIDGNIGVRPVIKFCLSVDHRAVDGAVAAGFLNRLAEILQTS